MTNPTDSAFPVNVTITPVPGQYSSMEIPSTGLSKREYFACAAMQGMCETYSISIEHKQRRHEVVAACAVKYADALLAELSKEAE